MGALGGTGLGGKSRTGGAEGEGWMLSDEAACRLVLADSGVVYGRCWCFRGSVSHQCREVERTSGWESKKAQPTKKVRRRGRPVRGEKKGGVKS